MFVNWSVFIVFIWKLLEYLKIFSLVLFVFLFSGLLKVVKLSFVWKLFENFWVFNKMVFNSVNIKIKLKWSIFF